MARVEPEPFADRELTRVIIAATRAEALRAENVLRGVDAAGRVRVDADLTSGARPLRQLGND